MFHTRSCLKKRNNSFVSCLLILQNVHYFGDGITSFMAALAAGKTSYGSQFNAFSGALVALWDYLAGRHCDFLKVRDCWRCEYLFGVVWAFWYCDRVHSGFLSVLIRPFGSLKNSLMSENDTFQLPLISWRYLFRIWLGWKSHYSAIGTGGCLATCF